MLCGVNGNGRIFRFLGGHLGIVNPSVLRLFLLLSSRRANLFLTDCFRLLLNMSAILLKLLVPEVLELFLEL